MSNYYDKNSKQFIDMTINCNMEDIYSHFTKYLKKNYSILDAGCGSGRDSLYFKNSGYDVTAFDLSEEMVKSTKKVAKIDVYKLGFLDIKWKDNFNAIWACASLLHVKRDDMSIAFKNLYNSLKDDGIMYCSFKLRNKDYSKDGRSFTCYNKESFSSFINNLELFKILEIYVTADNRKDRENELWLNAILQKN